MDVNIPLLRKAVEWVEEQEQLTEDREWYQGSWITPSYIIDLEELQGINWCNTAFCLAGAVVTWDGWKPHTEESGRLIVKDGKNGDTEQVANELLGLEHGHGLFHYRNTAADIRRIAEQLAGEPL